MRRPRDTNQTTLAFMALDHIPGAWNMTCITKQPRFRLRKMMRRITCDGCPVRAQGAICAVPAEAQEDFRRVAQATVYKVHQVVFAEGNPCSGLYLVCHGAVKLYHSDRFGREHILEIAGPGAVLGEFALDSAQPLSISAETLTEAQLSYLPRERLEWFVQQYPATAIRLIDALGRELARARRKVRDLALKGAEARLAALLLQLTAAPPKASTSRPQLHYRRRELAEMIGVSTETAIRLLTKLRTRGVISIDRRDIAITDPIRLKRIAGDDETGA
jgi:CRP-like cAMP-binding protein